MCCIVTNILRIFLIFISVLLLFVVALIMLLDLNVIRKGGSFLNNDGRITLLLLHCFCGTLMTVLKLKDICFLHWWQLMTLAFIISGFAINYLQPESDGFGVGQKACNYFVLEYMLLTLLAVSYYTRALKSQQEV